MAYKAIELRHECVLSRPRFLGFNGKWRPIDPRSNDIIRGVSIDESVGARKGKGNMLGQYISFEHVGTEIDHRRGRVQVASQRYGVNGNGKGVIHHRLQTA